TRPGQARKSFQITELFDTTVLSGQAGDQPVSLWQTRYLVLDLADQVEAGSNSRGAFVPLGRADLARVLGHVLGSLDLAQSFLDITSDGVVMDFQRLDHAFRIDDEGAAQCQALFIDVHAESAGQ